MGIWETDRAESYHRNKRKAQSAFLLLAMPLRRRRRCRLGFLVEAVGAVVPDLIHQPSSMVEGEELGTIRLPRTRRAAAEAVAVPAHFHQSAILLRALVEAAEPGRSRPRFEIQ